MISRRRLAFPLFGFFFAAQASAQGAAAEAAEPQPRVETPASVPQWGMFEVKISGLPAETKAVEGRFGTGGETKTVAGFRDGDLWRVRFMPASQGKYEYMVRADGNRDWRGEFEVTEPEPGMHGPVHVKNKHHFAHEDGTPFYPVGTTCYAWLNQPEPVRKQSLP